jgi:hypothetical protein
MAKIHVWMGNFQLEKDFRQYIDQSKYFKASQIDDEHHPELRCQFCKEIDLDYYDDDFIVIQFNKKSHDLNQLISIIPANADKIIKACEKNKLEAGNALIYYTDEKLNKANASKSTLMAYLGFFEEVGFSTVVGGTGLQGLNNHLWAGVTKKSKEEFMEYFNQDEYLKKPSADLRCQFCKDVNIKNYNPNALYIFYGEKLEPIEKIIKATCPDQSLYHSMIDIAIERGKIKKANALFCYVDNGYRDRKKDQVFLIYRKESRFKKTKEFSDELENYNDLKYIGCFLWD